MFSLLAMGESGFRQYLHYLDEKEQLSETHRTLPMTAAVIEQADAYELLNSHPLPARPTAPPSICGSAGGAALPPASPDGGENRPVTSAAPARSSDGNHPFFTREAPSRSMVSNFRHIGERAPDVSAFRQDIMARNAQSKSIDSRTAYEAALRARDGLITFPSAKSERLIRPALQAMIDAFPGWGFDSRSIPNISSNNRDFLFDFTGTIMAARCEFGMFASRRRRFPPLSKLVDYERTICWGESVYLRLYASLQFREDCGPDWKAKLELGQSQVQTEDDRTAVDQKLSEMGVLEAKIRRDMSPDTILELNKLACGFARLGTSSPSILGMHLAGQAAYYRDFSEVALLVYFEKSEWNRCDQNQATGDRRKDPELDLSWMDEPLAPVSTAPNTAKASKASVRKRVEPEGAPRQPSKAPVVASAASSCAKADSHVPDLADGGDGRWSLHVGKAPAQFRRRIAAAHAAHRSGIRFEAHGASLAGSALRGFNRVIRRDDGSIHGEIDIELSHAFVEMTEIEGGKRQQITRLARDGVMNPRRKTVIFYAPNYRNTDDLAYFRTLGVRHVTDDESFLVAVHRLGTRA